MKKVLFILLFSIFTINLAFCSDIVITKDSKRLEVKIVEIVEKGLRVKKLNNLEGPTYLIPKTNVVTVIFEDGTVKQFNEVEDLIFQEDDYGNNQQYNDFIDKKDVFYYLGNKRMNESEYLDFIQKNCPKAWQSYQKGTRLRRCGGNLLGDGIGMLFIGVFSLTLSPENSDFWNAFGISCLCFSEAFAIASIPCLVVGGIKKNNSHEVYNEVCASHKRTAVTFGIGLSGNGIGLAMNF